MRAEATEAENQVNWIERTVSARYMRMLRAGVWASTIVAGLLEAWANRFCLSPDAVNYLDIASAYLRGHWKNAVNAYWSPLFSWLLAAGLALTHPSGYWESTLVHAVNFAGLLVTLRCFEYFFSGALEARKGFSELSPETEAVPELAQWALGYGVFLSTIFFVELTPTTTTPDIWVCALTCLAGGLMLRIWARGGGWGRYGALGVTLGCAYLAKAFYFPMSFVFLLTAWLAGGNPRKTLKQAVLATMLFAAIALPWVVAVSREKGRWTFGDVGKLAFVMTIDRVVQPLFWQGENDTGTPMHPVRQVLSKPRLFEFATPIGGTYPPGLGWSYWMEGAEPHFDLRGQLAVLRQSFGTFVQLFFFQAEFAAGLVIFLLLATGSEKWEGPAGWMSYFLPAPLIACCGYGVVLVEGRYVAPFLLLLWVAAYCGAFQAVSGISRRTALCVVLGVVGIGGLRVAKMMESNLVVLLAKPQNVDWEVAQALKGLGLQPGDGVGVLCTARETQWARIAGVKVVAEIPLGEEQAFWTGSAEAKERVFAAFAASGARMVVTNGPPMHAPQEGWVALGQTAFYVHVLPGARGEKQERAAPPKG
jgi:4-amino-4-deoxy-L-arabinose transferase-like glycosyltransferase